MKKINENEYDKDGNAKHYDKNRVNVIELLERSYGTENIMIFCEMNALKYRLRIGNKKSQEIEMELKKIEWYEKAAEYYYNKILSNKNYIGNISYEKINLPWL